MNTSFTPADLSPASTDLSPASLADSCPASSAGPHPLAPYGWDEHWAAAFAPYTGRGLLPGRVVRVARGRCDLVTPAGPVRAGTGRLVPRDPAEAVCTGDWAAVDPDGDPRPVRAVLPRRTAFVRSTSSERSEGQVLAANIDHAVVCVPLTGDLPLARIERFLALAWESGARPLVALTEADQVTDPVVLAHLVQDVEAAAPGVPVLPVSSLTGGGLDTLAACLAAGTSVLLGQSGAGKSTLVNALLGERARDVGAVRDADGKGRHTTTSRDLLVLPAGGVLIDTPGLRGVGLWDAGDGVGQVFAEIADLAARCRFHDCAHEREPGCAVLAAVDAGDLPVRRLESYRKLMRENERIAARSDARLRAERRRAWRRRDAEGRAAVAVKRGRPYR